MFLSAVTDTKATITIPSSLKMVYITGIVLAGPNNNADTRTLEVIPLLTSPIDLR